MRHTCVPEFLFQLFQLFQPFYPGSRIRPNYQITSPRNRVSDSWNNWNSWNKSPLFGSKNGQTPQIRQKHIQKHPCGTDADAAEIRQSWPFGSFLVQYGTRGWNSWNKLDMCKHNCIKIKQKLRCGRHALLSEIRQSWPIFYNVAQMHKNSWNSWNGQSCFCPF